MKIHRQKPLKIAAQAVPQHLATGQRQKTAAGGYRPAVGTKAERRAARKAVAGYHEARLGELIEYIAVAIDRYRAGEIDAYRGSGSNRCKNNGERRAAQARPWATDPVDLVDVRCFSAHR